MTDQVNDTPDQVDAPAPSANEVEARTAGWVPKEEYSGDENKWVDADEFVRRGPLFEKINVQSRELKEVKKALDQLKVHHAGVKEAAFKEALATLKAEKREAFVDGDPDKIIEIDDKIAEIKDQQRAFAQDRIKEVTEAVQADVHPEFSAWTSRNPWYTSSAPMKAFADALGIELKAAGHSPSEILRKVEAQVKEEFPNKFRNANRDKAAAVEGAGKGSGKGASGTVNDNLSDFERQAMKRFSRMGIMTEDEYKAELKKTKENN
jgi:hypothetical protein